MNVALFVPAFALVAGVAAPHAACWLVADLVLEHVGIPFVDRRAHGDGR